MSQTRVFVSSTCYDLAHLRQSLSQHIAALGHIPILSESSSFHVDAQMSNIDNCRENVKNNCDVFVLIIGGRRGSVDKAADKSIVNIEYEAAVLQGLDIFVFIDHAVLNLLPIWNTNKNAILTPVIDSNEIMVFIDQIRTSQRWTFPFYKDTDVSEMLAKQLSGQLRQLLQMRRTGHLGLGDLYQYESELAVRIVTTRPAIWEYALTAELLQTRLARRRKQFSDVQAGRVLGLHKKLSGKFYMDWVSSKFPEAMGAVDKFVHLLTEELGSAWGPIGVSGSPADILRVAQEFDEVLSALLDLESDVYRTHGPDCFAPVNAVMRGMTEEMFASIEDLLRQLGDAVQKGRSHKESDGPLQININLVFTFSKAEQFTAALDKVQATITAEDWNGY